MTILQIVQLLVSVLLILAIVLQQRGAGSSIITGGSGGASYYSKRGFEQFLFIATIILSVLFILLGIAVIIIY